MRTWNLAWMAALFTALSPTSWACSTFALHAPGETLVGKSYDWHQPHGRVLINPRNLAKTSLVLKSGDQSIKWTSKFGSLTFNQHGQDLPLGGMNEAGLVVEIMWLDSSVYPGTDSKPTFNELQWIQYQLDNFSKTSEVVAQAPNLRVSPILAKVHYMVCDVTADCATFEYINKQLVIHQNLPLRTLTNSTYAESVRSAKKYVGLGGTLPLPKGGHSLSRFARAAYRTQGFKSTSPSQSRAYAFGTLSAVQAPHTKFQIVYSAESRRVDFKTAANGTQRFVELKGLSFSCLDGVRWLDANAPLTDNLTGKFMAFGVADNRDLVQDGLKGFENQLPPGVGPAVANFPQTFQCQE